MSILPDQNLAYREALDNKFHELIEDWPEGERNELADIYYDETTIQEPLTYTYEDIEEGWGADIEEGIEVMNHAMDKDILDEIHRKEKFLKDNFSE